MAVFAPSYPIEVAPMVGALQCKRGIAMNMKMIVPAVLGALVLSSPAWAQSSDSKACETLMQQFDRIDPHHVGKVAGDEEARAMRKEGGDMCAAGNHSEGAQKIRDGLAKWGVRPLA